MYYYKITDRSKIDDLSHQSLFINQKYGAEVIVGSPMKALEGDTLTHMVILEFRDFEAAQKYYNSDEHRELSLLRNKITEGWSSIVPGVSETQKVVDSGYFECKS